MNPNDNPRNRRNPDSIDQGPGADRRSIEDLPEDSRDRDLGAREPLEDRRKTTEDPVVEKKTEHPGDDEEDIDG